MTKKQIYSVLTVLGFILFPFFALILFVHPQGDDFFFAAKVNELGVLGFVKDMYFYWSGRYSSMFIGAFDPLRFESLTLFRFSLLFFQILFITSIFTVLRSIVKSSISHIKILIFTLAFYTIFINGIPDILEFLYWFPSVTAYQLSITLYLFFIANYFFNKTRKISNNLYLVLNSVLAIIIIGLIELMVLPMIVIQVLILLNAVLNKKHQKREIFLLMLIIISTIILLLAPGNYVRLSKLPESAKLIPGIIVSFKSFILISGYYAQSTTFLFSTLLLMTLFSKNSTSNIFIFSSFPNIKPVYLALISFTFLAALFFPAAAAFKHLPPGRVFNFVAFFLLALLTINIVFLTNYYRKSFDFRLPKIYTKIMGGIIIISLFSGVYVLDQHKFAQGDKKACFLQGNVLTAYYNLLFEANNFDKDMAKKKNKLSSASAQNKKTLIIKPPKHYPKMLLLVNWNEDQYINHWLYNWEVEYYNLDSIYIEPRKKE